jgi:DNA polymerase III epsilon subunit-like protein
VGECAVLGISIGAVTVRNGKIVELDFLADPERLAQLDLTILDG